MRISRATSLSSASRPSRSEHTYQVLTKRPSRAKRLAERGLAFPPNLWLGTSVENGAIIGVRPISSPQSWSRTLAVLDRCGVKTHERDHDCPPVHPV
ncbi:DUF5131 family protein [Nocardia nepalensis]|uniref:DUF5131 family protein n=1 Tax=Nocardia nepalensis TaxID=3375448 RepID=UPI003B67896E